MIIQDARVGNSMDEFASATVGRVDEVLQFQLSLRHARRLYEKSKRTQTKKFNFPPIKKKQKKTER
jgi:hypothetical protein